MYSVDVFEYVCNKTMNIQMCINFSTFVEYVGEMNKSAVLIWSYKDEISIFFFSHLWNRHVSINGNVVFTEKKFHCMGFNF